MNAFASIVALATERVHRVVRYLAWAIWLCPVCRDMCKIQVIGAEERIASRELYIEIRVQVYLAVWLGWEKR